MQTTTNYGLKKPQTTDLINVDDFNFNADILDDELNKRPEKDGAANNMTVTFDDATTLAKPTTGEKLSIVIGKVALAITKLKELISDIGTTDISEIGDGKIKGAISQINADMADGLNKRPTSTTITVIEKVTSRPSDAANHPTTLYCEME